MDDTPAAVHERGMVTPAHDATSSAARVLWVFGLALWLLTALVSVWEGLALQSPLSALHVGVLVGPITQLRNGCFVFGTGAVLLAQGWPTLFARGRGRVALGLLLAGAIVQLLALAYAAASGILAVQLNDPRDDARAALYARLCAHLFTSLGLGVLCVRAVRVMRERNGELR